MGHQAGFKLYRNSLFRIFRFLFQVLNSFESTEEQHDESDDKDETLQDTFKKYHMTSQDYGANCDEDLEQFLKEFSDKSEDEDPEVKAKIRKYSQKMEVCCLLKNIFLFKILNIFIFYRR